MGNRIAFISVRRIFPDVSFCFIQCPFIVSSPFSTLSHKNSTLWYACAKNGRTHTPYREKKRKLTQNKVYLLFNCHLSIAKRRMKKNPNRITFVFVKILILECSIFFIQLSKCMKRNGTVGKRGGGSETTLNWQNGGHFQNWWHSNEEKNIMR